MIIKCIVAGQTLSVCPVQNLAEGTVNAICAEFTFSSEWRGLAKTAFFMRGNDGPYQAPISSDGTIAAAAGHLNFGAGLWKVSVAGEKFEDGKVVRRLTTGVAHFVVSGSIVGPEGQPFPGVPPTGQGEPGKPALIGDNGNWLIYNIDLEEYVDTGLPSRGADITITDISESTESGGTSVVMFSDGKTLSVKNGIDGAPGRDGIDGAPGRDGADGAPGRDGTDGTSVSITDISESTESGGTSVVTFSDGKTLSVRNGLDGQGGGSSDQIVTYEYSSVDYSTIKTAVDSGKAVVIRDAGSILSWSTGDGGVSFSGTVYLRLTHLYPTYAEFHGAATVGGSKYDLRLTIKKDGTKIAEAVKLGGAEVTEQTVSGWGFSKFDGDYNSLSNKPTIPDVSGLYTKPDTGIPTTDYADHSVTNAKIAFGAVSTGQLAGGSVTAAKLNADVDAHIIEVVNATFPNAEGVGF